MLSKLLKYDLKWVYKPLIVFYILLLIFSIFIRIIESAESTFILNLIDNVCLGIIISIIISILINLFMRNWARFIKNIYKDESYLTHTLPVSKNKIYLSKVLTSSITLLSSFVVIIICLVIGFLNNDTYVLLKNVLQDSVIYFDISMISLILIIFITIFFEILFMILSGILGIIIGHKYNGKKIVNSVLIGFIIYMTLSILSVVLLYVVGLLNSDIMSIFRSTMVKGSVIKNLMLISSIIYLIYDIGIYFIGNKLFNKGVNVD